MDRRKGLLKTIVLLFLLFSGTAFSQNGWRDREGEVKVFLHSAAEEETLSRMNLNGDIHPALGFATMYLTPTEAELVKAAGLNSEVTIPDLNDHFRGFWKERAEAYHSYDEIIALMDSLATAFPDICMKIQYGTSVQGRQLACLKISDHVAETEKEPQVLFDGGIHGDEIGGPENLIRFARYLCTGYGNDPEISDQIDRREIFIYPMVNPDGRVNMSRYNGNYVDCNRDYCYMWDGQGNSPAACSQPETRAMRTCMYEHRFSVHVTYHSGEQIVLYPWCYRAAHAPDYPALSHLATVYSASSGYSSLSTNQSYADYPTNGETIDYSYGTGGTAALTMEISYNKQPPATQIQYYYQMNVPAMMAMIKNAGFGIEGAVTDSITGQPVRAAIFVNGLFPVYTDSVTGWFHKYLTAGSYSVKVLANGYLPRVVTTTVADQDSTETDLLMQPDQNHYAAKVAEVAIPGNNPQDEAFTPASIGAPDSVRYSLGRNGWIILDMQDPVPDITGYDLMVYENDITPEGYSCYAGNSMDGPWEILGGGMGTMPFDLLFTGLPGTRFIKIQDDGDGTQNAADAGFDLDAVSALFPPVGIPGQTKLSQVRVTPNPAGDFVVISAENLPSASLYILDPEGRVVYRHDGFTGRTRIDVSGLPAGIYFVKIDEPKGFRVGKFVVR
jgi:hypothetical protein